MRNASRRWFFSCFILGVFLCSGCNLLSLPYFLMMGPDPLQDPELIKLAADDKDKEVRVVILAYSGLETRPDFIQVDHELTGLVVQQLQKGFKENKEKVTIVPPGKVKKYKDNHPKWYLDLNEVGKSFEADYVVYMEIESLSLYEEGSSHTLFRGRAAVSVTVADVHKPDDFAVKKHFDCEFPKTKGPIAVGDENPIAFRQSFLEYVAKHLSWYFTSHPVSEDISCE